MGFFDSFRNFKNNLDKVESTVYSGSDSLLEVYEKNAKLEAEIVARTKELDRANRQMLTLQHIWEMMNSSKPLSSVLNAIVNSLQGELGYLYSFIVKQRSDNDGKYLQIVASSRDDLGEKFSEYLNCDLSDYRMLFPEFDELKNSVKNNQIYQSKELVKLITGFIPSLDKEKVAGFLTQAKMKSYILVPLVSKQTHFGSLIVFSSRENISNSELNFLSLFAKQIELAITIADLFQAVKEQAITDGMTGLYNRRYFEEYIKKEAIRAMRQKQKFTFIGLDLDHLKQINDTYGHSVGDELIIASANCIRKAFGEKGTCYRLGGDEFCTIILNPTQTEEELLNALDKEIQNYNHCNNKYHISIARGMAWLKQHDGSIMTISDWKYQADQKMYENKGWQRRL